MNLIETVLKYILTNFYNQILYTILNY